MRTLTTRPQLRHQPLRLTEEDKQHLPAIFEDFFTSYHLQEVREILWNWLVTALSTDKSTYAEGQDRSNLICFYEKLETIIEALYVEKYEKRHKAQGTRHKGAPRSKDLKRPTAGKKFLAKALRRKTKSPTLFAP